MQAFDVYLKSKHIDTVFYSDGMKIGAEEVKKSLVEHDGYDSRIVVRKVHRSAGSTGGRAVRK